MFTYEMGHLLKMWEFDKVSQEQAIGQLLVHMKALTQRVNELERQAKRVSYDAEIVQTHEERPVTVL